MNCLYHSRLGPTPLEPVIIQGETEPIWCKLEFLNPSGSIKDRIASYILQKALRSGAVAPEGRVVEASSGSTSIAMALACAQLGLHFTAVMPETVSRERILMISAFGAEIHLTPPDTGIAGCLQEAEKLHAEGAFYPRQFANPDNAEAHRRWTAAEIVNQMPGGQVDAVVSGVGTGGTIVGLCQGLCDYGTDAAAIVAKPREGRVLGDVECCSFSARIPGVVDGISQLYSEGALHQERIVDVPDEMALSVTRELIAQGYPVGPSSGLNVAAAVLARREFGFEHLVTVFPDRMERYFSTELFAKCSIQSR